jgi:hypothetical protein
MTTTVYDLLGKKKSEKKIVLPRAANPDEQVSASEFLPSGPDAYYTLEAE